MSEFFRNKPSVRIADALAEGAVTYDNGDGTMDLLYLPQPKQRLFHASTLPNLIMEGRRGTGKSVCIRWDAHMRAMAIPGFTYIILRRTMPELRKSHLLFISGEMERLGGTYLKGASEAHYPNGSVGLFGHCETEADIEKYLGVQVHAIYFDEITTFPWDWVTKISAASRVATDSGVMAIVRGGTNPLGVSAEEVYRYFISREVTIEEDEDYLKEEWGSIHLTSDDNAYIDYKQYDRRLAGLPEAYKKAWLDGQWGVEGAYFDVRADHVIPDMPVVTTEQGSKPMLDWPWLNIYRVLDWGWHDPTVCAWIAVLPSGRAIPFMEHSWIRTPADEVAEDIKRLSDGMKIVTTFADPTLWDGEKEMGHCLADEFELRGIPLTAGVNDRTQAGFAIQNYLNTTLEDGRPKLLFYGPGTSAIVRTLRAMRVDKKRPGRIADHRLDHFPIALGYFCMAGVGPTQVPRESAVPRWMRPKPGSRRILGSDGVRTRLQHAS